ncbi:MULTISPECIES: RNA polymerase factor sigma-54 [Stenotrophomonas]|uniref:RNA polymerase sigma-54 factor n=1 Tax=Stenotrophomonas nitritireducens TaxID=83617 RepID=A0ABR5NFX1_9GAMM|nr:MULTISPECIES: RNA polymerase factor sigma-54 [Stenotrophomonas]KQN98054.1 RNA polymerase sigma-54 factor [Stenotrophomonas sp. Leaf70]KRG54252.1 RNA polymerase sigma54 factor [Stenotrophomonas nitritireducens]
MKTTLATQLGQQLHLTPALLQSIRLLQLNGMQLEQEIRQALENNPLLELEEEATPAADASGGDAQAETAAFDELPESSMWDVAGASWNDAEEDRTARLAMGESSDPHLRILQALALDLDEGDLSIAAFWLEHCDDAGYLQAPLPQLTLLASARFDRDGAHVESIRQRLLQGEPAGMAARDLRECLQVQLAALPGAVPARHLAARLLGEDLQLLASHDYAAIARQLDAEQADVLEAIRLILSLQPRPADTLQPQEESAVIPEVVAWRADGQWRVALNPATAPRVTLNPTYERALAATEGSAAQPMREMLQEARWFTRGLSMRYDTLLRTARVIVERQAAFLAEGEEAMAPLTLKEVADAIGMHESTVSRITSGKYMQTPRGTFELKHFFAVRLDGASISGQAVKAMVRRLIESEPAARPLADEAIAVLLSRQGVNIARRTVAKYREQLDIAPARERKRHNARPLLARAG